MRLKVCYTKNHLSVENLNNCKKLKALMRCKQRQQQQQQRRKQQQNICHKGKETFS